MDADGSDLSRLTPRVPGKFGLFVGWMSPSWSPDGTRIAYSYSPKANVDRDVWVMSADGSDRHRLATTPGCAEVDVDWSPKGGRLVTTCVFGWGRKDLRLMSADGRHVRTLLASKRPNGTQAPDWSPDGRRIVFSEFEPNATAVAVVEAAGGPLVRLTGMERGVKVDPVWSPDGRWIAFASFAKGRNGIYVMNADGTGLKRLTGGGGTGRSPAWQPAAAQ
jgi:TolB protein